MTHRALILDRDGVVNLDTGYVHRISECRFVDGIFDLTAAFAARGYQIVIATNQAGIARGYYSEADFDAFMAWMRGVFAEHGVEIAGIYYCPDHPQHGIGRYRRTNDRRKPGPGMLLQAIKDLRLDPAACWTVGDKQSDIEAGRRAGIGTLVLFDPSRLGIRCEGDVWQVGRLAEIASLLETSHARP